MRGMKAGWMLPLAVLLFALFVTYELFSAARRNAANLRQTAFDVRVEQTLRRVEQRMHAYEQVLRGARGMFVASRVVTREEFRDYVRALDIGESYPGIEGIGYSVFLRAEQKAQHIAAVRAEGFPNYDIKPPGERDAYSAIVYLEPFAGRNLRAFGFDMYSEPVRREAMEQARDTGRPVISGKVTLVQESGADAQVGFLMYLAVYSKKADSLEERRANLLGWVYAPFRMNDLMSGLDEGRAESFGIALYDGRTVSPETRMYDNLRGPPASYSGEVLKATRNIEIAGHEWTLVATSAPMIRGSPEEERAELIQKGGVSIALLLALVVWLLLDDRARALKAAQQAMHLALYDVLTGLPNRKLITERLGQAIATARREGTQLAFLFIDLDKFKPVNDEYGHAIGDLLLKEVARRLRDCCRQSDTAARLGGDEFVMLLPHIEGKEGATVVAAKALEALSKPFEISGLDLSISASIGIALYPTHGTEDKVLMRHADTAMYHAKKSGKNAVRFYEPGMTPNGH